MPKRPILNLKPRFTSKCKFIQKVEIWLNFLASRSSLKSFWCNVQFKKFKEKKISILNSKIWSLLKYWKKNCEFFETNFTVFYKKLNQTLLKLNPNTSFNLYIQFLKVNIREGQKELNDLMWLVCVVGKFENEVNDLMKLL